MYVFDIDGTLSDPSHRMHFIESKPKDWDAFYDASDRNEIFDEDETMHNDWAALKRAIDKALGDIA